MKSAYSLFIFMLIITLSACGSKITNKEKATIFNKFPAEVNLNETNYFEVKDLMISGLLLYQDSLLLLRNANSQKWHFSILNLNNNSFLPRILESGRQPDQAMSFMSYGIMDNNLWAFDIIKNQIIMDDIDSIIQGKRKNTKTMDMPVFYYSVQLLSDHEFVGSGDYEDDYWLSKTDLLTGQKTKQLGLYQFDNKQKFTVPKKMDYESFLFLKPSKDKCVLAARYSDRIQIFDLNADSTKIIKGPENFEPNLVVLKGQDGKEISTRGQNTRYAFVKGNTTDKYIYLLYSGNNHESNHLHYGKYIYVYDWNGNPIKKITMSDYALDFVVTHDDSKIYTYNPKSKYIKSAHLR